MRGSTEATEHVAGATYYAGSWLQAMNAANVSAGVTMGDPVDDFLDLELDGEDHRVHLHALDKRIVAVLTGPCNVTRYNGWISVGFADGDRDATLYMPADRFSHLVVYGPAHE